MISTGNDELSVARSVSVLIVAVLIYMTNQTLRPAVGRRIHTSSDCNTPLLAVWRGILCPSREATFTAFRAHCRNQLQHLCVKERLWAIGEHQLLTLVAMERGSDEESITCPSFTPCGGFLPSLFITSVVQSVPSEPLSRSSQSCAVWLSLLVPHGFERLNDNRTPAVAYLPPAVSFLFLFMFLEKMLIP